MSTRLRPGSMAEKIFAEVEKFPGITLIDLVKLMRKRHQVNSEPRVTAELFALVKNRLIRRERADFVDQWRHFASETVRSSRSVDSVLASTAQGPADGG